MYGLQSGIHSGASGVIAAMRSSINQAVAAAKAAAQIHSPSKRFADEVGSQFPAGIGKGVRDNTDSATDAVTEMVDATRESAGGIFGSLIRSFAQNKGKLQSALSLAVGDMSILADARVVSVGTAQTAAGGTTTNNRNVNQNVNINNTFNGDKAIQQKAAAAMDDAAEDVTAELARGLAFAR